MTIGEELEFQQRVVDEKAQLDEKIKKLAYFLNGSVIETLESEDQTLLHEQFHVMEKYSDILRRRIARFKS